MALLTTVSAIRPVVAGAKTVLKFLALRSGYEFDRMGSSTHCGWFWNELSKNRIHERHASHQTGRVGEGETKGWRSL
jgi:hypothetical protein